MSSSVSLTRSTLVSRGTDAHCSQPFPQIISALTTVYVVSFFLLFRNTSRITVLSDKIQVITKDFHAARHHSHGHSKLEQPPVKELAVRQTLVAQEKPPQIWRSLLTGLPSPTSKLATIATFAANLLLFALVLDMTYRAAWLYPSHDLAFSRVGYVSDSTASILLREPDVSRLPLLLTFRTTDSPPSALPLPHEDWRRAGRVDSLSGATDFTAVLTIVNLTPDTRYQYLLSNNRTGHFITAPRQGEISARAGNRGKFSFLHTSCTKVRFPYSLFDHPLTIPGFCSLSKALKHLTPSFMLFLGDFIYVDVPVRHGSDVPSYRREYRQIYASPGWKAASTVEHFGLEDDSYSLPWLHVYDDHEIADDWRHNTTGVYPAALDPFKHYHMAANPPPFRKRVQSPTQSSSLDHTTYFTFVNGPAAFFLLDTRRFRSQPNTENSTMLGQEQLQDFLSWIIQPAPSGIRWKFVISSVPFTKNWRVNGKDTWGGFLGERRRVLEAMWDVNARSSRREAGTGIVILSGDRHEFAATAFPPPLNDPRWSPASTVHEFSASPLNMFYLPVRTYREDKVQKDVSAERDVCIKYIPEGNSKFGEVSIDSMVGTGQSLLRYRLFIDGEERWSHSLLSPQREQPLGSVRSPWQEGICS